MLALLVIYGGSIGIRSFVCAIGSRSLKSCRSCWPSCSHPLGVMRASHGSAAPALGVLFLLLAAVCYWGALSRFAEEPTPQPPRLRHLGSSASRRAVPSFFCKSPSTVPCLAAVARVFVYTRTRKMSLGMHASSFLAAATMSRPTPLCRKCADGNRTVGAGLGRLDRGGVGCDLVRYGCARAEDRTQRRILWVVPAVLVGFTAAALEVVAIVWLAAARMVLNASHLSVVRTIINCALALALGFLGSRWRRVELGWVAYVAVAFGTLKLLLKICASATPPR